MLRHAIAAAAAALALGAHAATPEGHYRAKCSSCHDAGLAHAPRLGSVEDWQPRLARGRAAIDEVALKGKPDTAMMAKGGYVELSDAEVIAIVDFMLSRLPAALLRDGVTARPSDPGAAVPAGGGAARRDDELLAELQSALRAEPRLPAAAIKVRVSAGVATLEGVVDRAEQVRLAEQVAARVPGVKRVDSKLISSALFEWD